MNRSRSLFLFIFSVLLLSVSCNKKSEPTAEQTAPPENAAETKPVEVPKPVEPPAPLVIPAGTEITVVTDSPLGSKFSKTGDIFTASVAEAVTVRGKVAIPKGSSVRGSVVEAKAKGKVKGEARLKLTLNKITIRGTNYLMETSMSSSTEKGKGKRTAATTGGGAAAGALIGGLAGGGKGAGIGALVGAGVGFAGGAMTGNKQIEIPAESALTFEITTPITLK